LILTCKKYQFDLPPEPNERNYFSLENKTLIDTIDLADYLIKGGLGKISYQSSKIDEENTQFIEAGSVDIQVLNIAKGWSNTANYSNIAFTLTDWFELNNFVDQFVFLIEIRQTESGELIWSGVIRKEGISFPQRNNEEMNISAISLDKEFAEYYSNKNLIPFDEFPIAAMRFHLSGLRFADLYRVFTHNFPNINFDFDFTGASNPLNYKVAERGYFYAPMQNLFNYYLEDTNTLSLMAGYEQFYLDNLDKYTYFNSIMLGMGWRWFFKGDTMYIRERYDESETITTLDYSEDFIGHGISLRVDTARKQVAVFAGQIYGARTTTIDTISTAMNLAYLPPVVASLNFYYLGGHTWKIYKDKYEGGNYNFPYKNLKFVAAPIIGDPNRGGYISEHTGENITVTNNNTITGGNEGKLTMKKISNVIVFWEALENVETFSFSNAETVLLKPYEVSQANGFHVDISDARKTNNQYYGNGNAYNGAQDAGNNGIYAFGTPATGMLRYNETTTKYEDYQYYVNSLAFQNNMKTYTGGSDKLIMNCVVNGIYNNPGERFQIANYPYSPIAGINFIAENVEIDLINNVTTLTLKSV
jgi:hypothetical protein